MKIQTYTSGIGSQTFVSRLMFFLTSHYDVKQVKDKPDIYFSSVWKGKPTTGCKRVHRVDGVYFNKLQKNRQSMNHMISRAINMADGVVYQSKYSRKSCYGILKVQHKNGIIIHNGFDGSVFKNIQVNKLGYQKMLLACAKWRSLKRPLSIARGFLESALANTVLVMVGDIDKHNRIKHPHIKYIGALPLKHVYQYYVSCDAVIHISRLDACPNVVVEALTAGKPVLCNNVGGTPEIVKDSGIILDIDPPFKYKAFSMKNPDNIDPRIIASGVHAILSKNWNIKRDDLSMEYCANKYYQFFKQVLEC